MEEELSMKEQKKDYPKSGKPFEDDYEELNITNRFMFNKVMSVII